MKNKKGFTLIELLAVITILAAIALITAPIIVNTINESRESTNTVSATNYIRAVDTTIRTETLDNFVIEDGFYKIANDGNICLNELKNGKCIGEKLKITAKGNKPIKGNVTIEDDEVTRATIIYDEFTVELGYDGEMEYFPVSKKYELGEEVVFNPGDGNKTWYVIDEDETTVTLIMNQNIGDETLAWYEINDNQYGPKIPFLYLNILSANWTNIKPIENFTYINNEDGTQFSNGYQKIEITKGETKLTSKTGTKTTVDGVTKARILSDQEALTIIQKLNPNYKEKNLRAYIERNLDALNEIAGTQLTTVEEVITFLVTNYPILEERPIIYQLIEIVKFARSYNIEIEYDMTIPLLTENLNSTDRYWLLTATPSNNTSAIYMGNTGFSSDYLGEPSHVRPVIIVEKTKLS